MNAFGAPSQIAKPPEKGSFPLDHYGECKTVMNEFIQCIQEHKGNHISCKHISRKYLECRMEQGLMLREELDNLGFHVEGMRQTRAQSAEGLKEGEGFIAGLGIKKTR